VHWLNGTRAKAVKSASAASLELQERVLGSIERLTSTVDKLQTAFEEHAAKLACLLDQDGAGASGSRDAVEEIKRDVQTVKGLLLSRFVHCAFIAQTFLRERKEVAIS
jgi:hypothetical protein